MQIGMRRGIAQPRPGRRIALLPRSFFYLIDLIGIHEELKTPAAEWKRGRIGDRAGHRPARKGSYAANYFNRMVVTQVRLLSVVGIVSVADRFSPVTATWKVFPRGSQISKNPFLRVLSR
jgi:hypothetical protein